MRLKDKTVIVTGATGGIGRVIARLFAREGACVVATGRNSERGTQLVDEIRAANGTAHFVTADISDEHNVELLVAETLARFGRIDALINNAGPSDELLTENGALMSLLDHSAERLDAILRAGLHSLFYMTKHSVAEMLQHGGGAIVNISSTAAVEGSAGFTAYSAYKGGLNAFTRATAAEYGQRGIRANTIIVGVIPHKEEWRAMWAENPRWVSDLLLSTRSGRPEDIAYAALYLASDEAEWVNGAELRVDGGMTCRSVWPPAAPIDDAT